MLVSVIRLTRVFSFLLRGDAAVTVVEQKPGHLFAGGLYLIP
jgi:hypothetical protein